MPTPPIRLSTLLLALLPLALAAPAATAGVCADILYVRNNGPGGDGSSPDQPVDTLPTVAPGVDVIYVYIGTGTPLNQSGGIILQPGQQLLGETIGYQDDCHDIAPTISAALPAITGSFGAPIGLSSNNEVAGIRVVAANGLGILGAVSVGSNIHDNVVEGAGIQLTSSRGNHTIADNEVTGGSIAFVQQDGATNLTIARNEVTDPTGNGIGVASIDTGPVSFTVTIEDNTVTGPENEAVELDTMEGATVTIRGNTLSDGLSSGIDLDEVSGVVRIEDNDLDDFDDDGILVEVQDEAVLDLTVERNEHDDSRAPGTKFGAGIEINARDDAMLTALVANNRVHDTGAYGIFVTALDASQAAVRIAYNEIEDADGQGIRLDSLHTAWMRATIEYNDVARSGSAGIYSTFPSTTLGQELRITDNGVEDAGADGIVVGVSGVGAHQLDAALDRNQVFRSMGRGLQVDGFIGGGSGELTFDVRDNRFTGNDEEGFRIDVASEVDAAAHIVENVFVNNEQPFSLHAEAVGEGGLCTVLLDNDADGDYHLIASGGGTHIYEDVLGTNTGDVSLETFDVGSTLGPVAVDTCRGVVLGELPVPEPMPEPGTALSALGCLGALGWLHRRRGRGGLRSRSACSGGRARRARPSRDVPPGSSARPRRRWPRSREG